MSTPKEVPSKSVSAPAAYSSPAPPPAAAPKEESLPETKDLEIAQEDDEDSEPELVEHSQAETPREAESNAAPRLPAVDNSAEVSAT